jgi:hypothetical protein
MPHWLIKCAVQRVISWLPASHWWNEQFQRHVTRSLELTPGRFELRVQFAQRHFDQIRAANPTHRGSFNALELGTGWYPVVPLSFWLAGADQVWTYDIAPLIDQPRLVATLEAFVARAQNGQLAYLLPAAKAERIARLAEVVQRARMEEPGRLLESLGIHVKVQDAQQTGLAPGCVDLFVSTGVLEYIPPAALAAMFVEFRRVARAGAVSSHYLNLVDQYHYFDRSISPLNFLRFSERQWRRYNSPLTWLNRLRYSDYHQLFRTHGWRIICDEPRRGDDADLDRVPLAPEFQRYERSDLLVLTAWIAAQMEPRTG